LRNRTPAPPVERVNIQFQLAGPVSFLRLDNRLAVFSERLQKIFELNDTSAYLAGCIAAKPTMPQLIQQLQRKGMTPPQALNTIKQFVIPWSRTKLLSAFVSTNNLKPTRVVFIAIAGHNVALQFYDNALANRVLPVFSRLKTRSRRPAEIFHLLSRDSLTYVFQDGKPAQVLELDQAAPVLKGMLTDSLLARDEYTLALHCAMLLRGDQALLLTGPPGAGKTTLTLELLARGFEYAADDITLLLRDGRVRGVSYAPALKSGAWELSKELSFQLSDTPIHKRMDGKRVKYISQVKVNKQTPVQVKWIANLHRNGAGSTRWHSVDVATTLKKIIKGAHAHNESLNDSQLRVLIKMIGRSTAGILEYANAREAAYLSNGFNGMESSQSR
jgi:hypothetical protein